MEPDVTLQTIDVHQNLKLDKRCLEKQDLLAVRFGDNGLERPSAPFLPNTGGSSPGGQGRRLRRIMRFSGERKLIL